NVYPCMDASLDGFSGTDHSVAQLFLRQRGRLRDFIRKRVRDPSDADDIVQDVFYELVEAARLVKPIEEVGAWMFRVARNRIIDLFRRQSIATAATPPAGVDADELADLLPAANAEPDTAYARQILLDELEAALDELPADQRDVFIAHELEGRSFKELAA